MNDQQDTAVLNNIIWCGIVCEMHGITHASSENIWGLQSQAPIYYPDIITSNKDVTAQQVINFIENREILSIKDSYANVDLGPFGYKILFEAEWIYHSTISNFEQIPSKWRVIKTSKELKKWTSAYELEKVIIPKILERNDVEIFMCEENGGMSGFIANVGANAIGISNVFSDEISNIPIWTEIAQIVASRNPGLPLVGYEQGNDLKAAVKSGWKSIGPLRVWMKDK